MHDESRSASSPVAPAKPADPAWERGLLEKLAFAALREQRSSRRWGIFFKLATFAYLTVLVLVGVYWSHSTTAPAETAKPHTAVISVNGVIDANGRNSAEKVIAALHEAFETATAKGVILRINSPGGSPVQSGMIADEMRRLREQHPDKPLHVVVEDLCASGGYYIASAAQNIYVDKASLVGSIGVIMDSFGVVDLMNKLGVERRAFTAGENKAFLDPFKPIDETQRKHVQGMLDNIHRQFITNVKTGRGSRLKETPEMFSGLVWTGTRAIELGLADGTGTVDSVARDVIKASDVVEYTVKENPLERLSKRFAAQAGEAMAIAMSRFIAQSESQSARLR